MREFAPFLIMLVVALVVSYHVFSSRPSAEELEQVQKEKTEQKQLFDANFKEISFKGVVTGTKRLVSRKTVGNTRFFIDFKQVNTPFIPENMPDTTFLYDLSQKEKSQIILGGFDGRRVRRGDTLIKNKGVNYLIIPHKKINDTLSFTWKLF